ncbi:unnamed protein product [Nyctereutes procyonoides]|nr:unnamed protein product [Nyctereutes procyonoides]
MAGGAAEGGPGRGQRGGWNRARAPLGRPGPQHRGRRPEAPPTHRPRPVHSIGPASGPAHPRVPPQAPPTPTGPPPQQAPPRARPPRRPRPRALAPPPRPGSESRSASSERGHGPARGVSRGLAGCGQPGRGAMSPNLRTALIFGGFISLVGAAFYPIYFRPLLLPEEYQKEQAVNRAGIIQEDVQPPGLKVWSDPFGRK